MMTQRQSTIAFTLLAAVYGGVLVLCPPDLDLFVIIDPETDVKLPGAAAGLIFAGPAFLALWAVHGRHRAIVRVPLTAWLCSLYLLAAIYGEMRDIGAGNAVIALLTLVAWIMAYLADLLALRLLRAVRGWRLDRIGDEPHRAPSVETSESRDRKPQFTIRTILAWTSAAAAFFAGLRWLMPYRIFDDGLPPGGLDLEGILFEGAELGLIYALASLPVVSTSLIILADGRRTVWRCVLALVTVLGIWGGVSATGLLLAEQQGDEVVVIALAIEIGVLLAGALAASLTRACGYRLRRGDGVCSRIRENSGPERLSWLDSPAADRLRSNRRFAFALAPLVTAALLLACYAPRRFETWRRADVMQRCESLGWHAEFDDEGHVTQLAALGQTAMANLKALAPELWPHLEYLQLYDQGQPVELAELPPLPNLQTLIVCGASDTSVSNLKRFPKVEDLIVSGHEFTDEGLQRLTALTKLKNLSLSGTGVLLEQSPTLLQLQHLNLHDTAVGDTGASHLDRFPNLQDLVLYHTNVTDRGLGALGGLKLLRTLNLQMTDIGDESLPVPKRLSQLKSLDLRFTAVSEAGFDELRSALPDTSITAGADDHTIGRAIFGVTWTPKGPGQLVPTRGLNQIVMLKHLHARGRRLVEPPQADGGAEKPGAVTDDGLALLAGQATMENLDLRDTAVTDAGLESLVKLSNLKRLDLRGTHVTEHGCQRLANTLPGCEILR